MSEGTDMRTGLPVVAYGARNAVIMESVRIVRPIPSARFGDAALVVIERAAAG